MLLDPEKYEAALWGYIGSSSTRANYLSGFLSERFSGLGKDYQLSARTISKLIKLSRRTQSLIGHAAAGSVKPCNTATTSVPW